MGFFGSFVHNYLLNLNALIQIMVLYQSLLN